MRISDWSSDVCSSDLLTPAEHFQLTAPVRVDGVTGETVEIAGRIVDGAGAPLPDALVEIWQADAEGAYGEQFPHFGSAATAEDGGFGFRTLRPGRTPGPGGALQAAHIAVGVLGRGLLRRLATRLYFEGEPGLEDDPVLNLVPPSRRDTLLARRTGPARYRYDIVLPGPRETVFFDS